MASEWAVNFLQFMNMSPVFKGLAVLIVGLLALYFAWIAKSRWEEPVRGGFLVFVGLSIFVTLYGLFVILFRPSWWALPY